MLVEDIVHHSVYGEGVNEAHECHVETSNEKFVCSHSLRGGSEPHLTSVMHSLCLGCLIPSPKIDFKTVCSILCPIHLIFA